MLQLFADVFNQCPHSTSLFGSTIRRTIGRGTKDESCNFRISARSRQLGLARVDRECAAGTHEAIFDIPHPVSLGLLLRQRNPRQRGRRAA